MRPNQSLSESAARILRDLNPIYLKEYPVATLVQGDTTSALMGALSSFYNHVPVAHVEAGLRTDDLQLPFPEEANRRLISVISQFHFTPTQSATQTLIREGHKQEGIIQTGNTGVDALLQTNSKILKGEIVIPAKAREISTLTNIVLVTCHRRETFGRPLQDICEAILALAVDLPELNFVFPVHPNPNVREAVERCLSGIKNIFLLPPLPYSHFVSLLANARVVITDSGGVQEEAPSLGKRTIVLRDLTERTEAVESGMAKMVGTNKGLIVKAVKEELQMKDQNKNSNSEIFGDGSASSRIIETLEKALT
jgi:UDP-N-acetylglucosamine 2-epimerase (non-hydrolysing)